MAVDTPPFDDPLVRQAFRLIPDRQGLIDRALLGFGTVGERPPGQGPLELRGRPAVRASRTSSRRRRCSPRRGRRTSRSRSTPPRSFPASSRPPRSSPSMAKDAGRHGQREEGSPNAYFDTSKLYTKLDFGQSFWTDSALGALVRAGAPLRRDLERDALARPASTSSIREAQGATDEATAIELWTQVQQIQYDEGGYIVWANLEILDAVGEPRTGRRAERVVQPRRLELPRRLARRLT